MKRKANSWLALAFASVIGAGQTGAAAGIDTRDLFETVSAHSLTSNGLTLPAVSKARDKAMSDRPQVIDVQHYDFDIQANPETGLIAGQVSIRFKVVVPTIAAVDLDSVDLEIRHIVDERRRSLNFAAGSDTLRIELARPLRRGQHGTVTIFYAALKSQNFFMAAGGTSFPARSVQAYTYTQPDGARAWFPGIDSPADKATMTMRLRVPEGYFGLSNGTLQQDARQDGWRVLSYAMHEPIATYLISLAVGPYEISDVSADPVPMQLFAPPELAEAARFDVSNTPTMIRTFSGYLNGPYPFSVYNQSVAEPWRTSMEHQAATTLGSHRITGDRSGEGVIAHELAHQWFGDIVTCRHWGELWLNEGFATYLPHIFYVSQGNEVQALGQLSWWRKGYFEEARDTAHPLSQINPNLADIFDSHAYEKGALVIRLLSHMTDRLSERPLLPGTKFGEALGIYLGTNAGKTVTSHELQNALETRTDVSWQLAFDQWIRSAGHPIVEASYAQANGRLHLDLNQVQAQRTERRWRTFSFPLEIELFYDDGTRELVERDIYDPAQRIEIATTRSVQAVLLDPRWLLPAEITLSQPDDAWEQVFARSTASTGRLTAGLVLIRENPLSEVNLQRLTRDSSPFLRIEMLAALTAHERHFESVAALLRAMPERDADVSTRAVMARAKAWLAIKAPSDRDAPRSEEEWRQDYLNAADVEERIAYLGVLGHLSLENTQAFAVERLAEARWMTKDRSALLGVLTKRPTDRTVEMFPALVRDAPAMAGESLTNLAEANFDNPTLVEPLLTTIKSHRYDFVRIRASKLAAKQRQSQAVVCPALSEVASSPAASAEVRAAASQAATDLGCPPFSAAAEAMR